MKFTVGIVSIPYRLATNDDTIREVIKGGDGFNPLQVGYKPKEAQIYIRQKQQFQSLIGWLQTFLILCPIKRADKFQSLIGWLQTQNYRLQIEKQKQVSIPYRLATNSGNGLFLFYLKNLFQSLIGWLQTVKTFLLKDV